MTDYLDFDDLLVVAERILGHPPQIRDRGLLDSALHRPQSNLFGEDSYPDLDTKAAALLLSLIQNHALLDGNKRLGWVSVRLFYGLNGHDLRAPRGEALEFVLAIAAGDIDDVTKAADTLRTWRT